MVWGENKRPLLILIIIKPHRRALAANQTPSWKISWFPEEVKQVMRHGDFPLHCVLSICFSLMNLPTLSFSELPVKITFSNPEGGKMMQSVLYALSGLTAFGFPRHGVCCCRLLVAVVSSATFLRVRSIVRHTEIHLSRFSSVCFH